MKERYVTADEVAKVIGGVVWGDASKKIYGIALPRDSDKTTLTYFESNASSSESKEIIFAVCVVSIKYMIPDNRTYIVISKRVCEIIHILVSYFVEQGIYKDTFKSDVIGRDVFIPKTSVIGRNCHFGNNVTIGDEVTIGDDCFIGSNVVIEHGVEIGNHVCIQSGAIIGCDSFEYAEDNGYQKIHNLGTVVIEDNVVIGSNTIIARGTIGDTIIGSKSIIDALVQIGHEVIIGKNCKVCAQCGLAGWAVLKDNVTLYGKVGVANYVVIENNAVALAMSGVSKNVKENTVVSGIPARENDMYLREKALISRLAKGENKNE